MISCNCVKVAVYCVIALLLVGNFPEDRILSKALMHDTVNTIFTRLQIFGESSLFTSVGSGSGGYREMETEGL